MRIAMEYKIISGSVVEVKRTWMNARPNVKKPRGQRIAGNTSERKIRQNEIEKKKQLARILNANIGKGWLLVTLKYDDAHLPADYEALKESGKKFCRTLRTAFKAANGRNPRMVLANANWNPTEDCPARLHHHIVIEDCSWDMLRDIWPTPNGVSIEPIDGRADHTALAVYLVDNVHGRPRGENAWSTSRGNLEKPIYTEPTPVDNVEEIEIIPTARQTAFERLDDEDGRAVSTYIRCILPCKPTVRGRQIILPRPQKRGGRKQRRAAAERSEE